MAQFPETESEIAALAALAAPRAAQIVSVAVDD